MRKKVVSLAVVLLVMALLGTQAFAATTTRNFSTPQVLGGYLTGTHYLTASRNSPSDNRYYGLYETKTNGGSCGVTFSDRWYYYSSSKMSWANYRTSSVVQRAYDKQYAYTTSKPIVKVSGVFTVESGMIQSSAMNLEAAY